MDDYGRCIDCIYCKELHYERDCVSTDVSHVCVIEVMDITDEDGIVYAPNNPEHYSCGAYKEKR